MPPVKRDTVILLTNTRKNYHFSSYECINDLNALPKFKIIGGKDVEY
jgi:hypothetical protein